MTQARYLVAKLFSSFGFTLTEKHRTATAYEAHLLRDAYQIIGGLTWKNVEDIEEVSSEYWSLRKLSKEHQKLSSRVETITETLETVQEERSQAIVSVTDNNRGPASQRDNIAKNIEQLSKEREEIQQKGRAIKRSHAGLKTKLEVLLEEQSDDNKAEIETTTNQVQELRDNFKKIKERREQLDKQITKQQAELNTLNSQISDESSTIREQAESQFSTIGKTNKELTGLRSSLSHLETNISALQSHIGKHLLQNPQDAQVKDATKQYKGLLNLIKEVKKSSIRHRKLIG